MCCVVVAFSVSHGCKNNSAHIDDSDLAELLTVVEAGDVHQQYELTAADKTPATIDKG